MSQHQLLLATLRRGPCTVGDLLRASTVDARGKFVSLAAEYRARISEARAVLRARGGDIVYNHQEKTYTLVEPLPRDPSGQLVLA